MRELPSLGRVEKYIITRTKKGSICAALIDPEDFSPTEAGRTAQKVAEAGASLILVGGSTLSDQGRLDQVVISIKHHTKLPVILFPGNVTGVSKHADAILFSSLLNSTNPYFIIGAQALGAMSVHEAGIESIPMGYLVFGNSSATSFIGQVNGIPPSKPSLAVIYALAAKYLGMRTLYLEGGSGASKPVAPETIRAVRGFYDGLLIVGGGIVNADAASRATEAGADIIVVGNLLQTAGYDGAFRQIVKGLARKRDQGTRA